MNKRKLGQSIRIDPEVPLCSGFIKNKDGCYVTADLALECTEYLENCAEAVREAEGLITLIYRDEDGHYQTDGAYHFYAEINDQKENRIEVLVRYTIEAYESWIDEKAGSIQLTESEQNIVLRRLDQQCRQLYGKSCKKLLAEARQRWRGRM